MPAPLALLLLVPLADPAPTPAASTETPTTTTPTTAPETAKPDEQLSEPEKANDDNAWDWGFGGLPALGYDADNGFLVGVVGQVYFHDPQKTQPYRVGVNAGFTITTKLVQDHYLYVDWLNVADLPLRIWAKVGYTQSLTQNYCGTGMTVTCDDALAEDAADDLGLRGGDRDDFIRRFYLFRFINPWTSLQARWALSPLPRRVEVFGGWRGSAWIPGTWADDDGDGDSDYEPYPGSFYAKDFPVGEPGFASILQAGIMYDTRDNEPSPRSGVWAETSLRAATPFWGSTWTWAGANATLRTYVPLVNGEAPARLTLASRVVGDVVVGDPPIQELVRPGGFIDYLSFGGSEMGRGVRAQRYVGKVKLYLQNELRWRFVEWQMFGQDFAASTNAFLDAGLIGTELFAPDAFGGTPPIGGGGALLLHWNENFILRVDVATSAVESYPLSLYIQLGQTF
jgi:hypothetical protein